MSRGTAQCPTILLVDDESGVRRLLRRIFVGLRYTVIEADNGLEALRLVHEQQKAIDLILTDIELPMMKGTEFAARVLDAYPEQRIVLMSAYASSPKGFSRLGVNRVVVPVLQKPLDIARLKAVVMLSLQETPGTRAVGALA